MTNKEIAAQWKRISACIADEIAENEEFAGKLAAAIQGNPENISPAPKKKARRRTPAKLDPFALLDEGTDKLAASLALLNVEELKDVIAAYGMDTAKLASKWKDRKRLETFIIEATERRSSRGGAFWNTDAGQTGDANPAQEGTTQDSIKNMEADSSKTENTSQEFLGNTAADSSKTEE